MKFKWEFFERLFRTLEILAILGGIIFAAIQLNDVRSMQSAQLMIEFDKRFDNESDTKLMTAIEEEKPIFVKNGGEFTEVEIDRYLSLYELIDTNYSEGLISKKMAYDAFSYEAERAYNNKEIRAYIDDLRKNDPELYTGFEHLAKQLIEK